MKRLTIHSLNPNISSMEIIENERRPTTQQLSNFRKPDSKQAQSGRLSRNLLVDTSPSFMNSLEEPSQTGRLSGNLMNTSSLYMNSQEQPTKKNYLDCCENMGSVNSHISQQLQQLTEQVKTPNIPYMRRNTCGSVSSNLQMQQKLHFVNPEQINLTKYEYRPVVLKNSHNTRNKSDDSMDTVVTGITGISGVSTAD